MKFGEVGRTIRLGIIGFGWRGYGQTETLLEMPDVEICAVCDVYPDRVELGKEMVKKARSKDCFGTTDYREVNRMEGIDAVVVMTDWSTHIRIAIDAMNAARTWPLRSARLPPCRSAGIWSTRWRTPAGSSCSLKTSATTIRRWRCST